MRKLTAILLIAMLTVGCCACSGTSSVTSSLLTPSRQEETVSVDNVNGTPIKDIFPDMNFAWSVALALGKESIDDKVTSDELEAFTGVLDCNKLFNDDPKPYLHGGDITALASLKGIGHLTGITGLSFTENKVTELPEEISRCTELKSICISGTAGFKTLNESIGKLKKLETLDVSGSLLESLPDSVCECTSLRKLVLRETAIVGLPDDIGKLQKLEILDLHGSLISELPDSFTELPTLRSLDCGSTGISRIPGEISNIKTLVRVDFSNCYIKFVPESVSLLKSLKYFNLSGNINISDDYRFYLPYEVYSCENDPVIE